MLAFSPTSRRGANGPSCQSTFRFLRAVTRFWLKTRTRRCVFCLRDQSSVCSRYAFRLAIRFVTCFSAYFARPSTFSIVAGLDSIRWLRSGYADRNGSVKCGRLNYGGLSLNAFPRNRRWSQLVRRA